MKWVRIAVMALSLSSVLVLSGPAPTAHALAGEQIFVPITVGGGATVAEGAVAACLSVVGCPAVAATVATAALAYGGYRLVKWAWGGSHNVEKATVVLPAVNTTYIGGCWASVPTAPPATSGSVSYADCPNDGATIGTVRADGISWNDYQSIAWALTIEQACARGQLCDLKFKASWAPVRPASTSSRMTVAVGCVNGTFPGASWDFGVTAYQTGQTSGTVSGQISAGPCSGAGGISTIRVNDNSAERARYYLKGTPSPVTEVPAPLHKWRGVKVCSGAGGTVTSYSAQFREADADLPALPNPDCPAGTMAVEWTVYEGDASGAGGTQILHWVAPTTLTSPTAEVSDCLPGGSAYPCSVHLLKWTGSPATWIECSTGINCDSFDAETSIATEYQCRWANVVVSLSDCAPLQAAPSTTPSTGGGSGTDLSPETPVNPDVEPSLVEDETNTNCVGLTPTWNPINWVVRPVKCALVWAFKPREDHLGDIQDAYNGSVVESLVQPVDAVGGTVTRMRDELGGSPSCEGPTAEVPMFGSDDFTFQPLNSCSGPAQTAAGVVKTGLSFLFLAIGGLAVARTVVGSFGIRLMGYPGGDNE